MNRDYCKKQLERSKEEVDRYSKLCLLINEATPDDTDMLDWVYGKFRYAAKATESWEKKYQLKMSYHDAKWRFVQGCEVEFKDGALLQLRVTLLKGYHPSMNKVDKKPLRYWYQVRYVKPVKDDFIPTSTVSIIREGGCAKKKDARAKAILVWNSLIAERERLGSVKFQKKIESMR